MPLLRSTAWLSGASGSTASHHSLGHIAARRAAAAVAIDAAQIKGVLPLSALRTTFPVFRHLADKRRAVSLTAEQFRFTFGNAVSEEESAAPHERWTIPGLGEPLHEATSATFYPPSAAKSPPGKADGGPLLISGGKDHTVPETVTRAPLGQYWRSDAVSDVIGFPDRGRGPCSRWGDRDAVVRDHVDRGASP